MAITRIAQVDVGAGGATSLSFTAIPATFTDLVVVFSLRYGSAWYAVDVNFNTDVTYNPNYQGRYLLGDGGAASSTSVTGFRFNIDSSSETANTFSNGSICIPNYASSVAKSFSLDVVTENNASGAFAELYAGSWTGTAAINAITINRASTASFVQYSSATLYGIKSGSGGATVT